MLERLMVIIAFACKFSLFISIYYFYKFLRYKNTNFYNLSKIESQKWNKINRQINLLLAILYLLMFVLVLLNFIIGIFVIIPIIAVYIYRIINNMKQIK